MTRADKKRAIRTAIAGLLLVMFSLAYVAGWMIGQTQREPDSLYVDYGTPTEAQP